MNVLRMLTVSLPVVNSHVVVNVAACIERFLSTSFTKLSQTESHIWTQADHFSPCLKDRDDCKEDEILDFSEFDENGFKKKPQQL